MEVTYQLKGYEEVRRAMLELPNRVARRVLKKAVADVAKYERPFLQEGAPVRGREYWRYSGSRSGAFLSTRASFTGRRRISWSKGAKKYGKTRKPGFLQKNIRAFYLRRKSKFGSVMYGVGPRGDAYYGYIVAYGHIVGKRLTSREKAKGAGATRSYVKAYDWITPVWNRTKYLLDQQLEKELTKGIMREGEKLGFKKSYGWYFG